MTARGSRLLLLALALQLLTPGVGNAQCVCGSSNLIAHYDVAGSIASNGSGVGDNLLRLINPTSNFGTLCAMIYVFDNDEEMGACCGCQVTPNQQALFSILNDLTDNWEIAGPLPPSGVINIVPTLSNAFVFEPALGVSVPACDPGEAATQVGFMDAFVSHNQAVRNRSGGSTTGLTEIPVFNEGGTDSTELGDLVATCHSIETGGSGSGICSCPPAPES